MLTVLALAAGPSDDAGTGTPTCDTSRYNCGNPPVGCTELSGDIVCTMGKYAGRRYDSLEDIPRGRTMSRDDLSGWE